MCDPVSCHSTAAYSASWPSFSSDQGRCEASISHTGKYMYSNAAFVSSLCQTTKFRIDQIESIC